MLVTRKVPIVGPGGGGVPLGDPSNLAYSVAVSNLEAVSWGEKASEDADVARLYPVKASSVKKATSTDGLRYRGKGQAGEKQGALTSISEAMATDALNAIRLSEGLLREDEENDKFGIAGGDNQTAGSRSTTLQPET